MKSILFLVKGYNSGAPNAICVKNISIELEKMGVNVDILNAEPFIKSGKENYNTFFYKKRRGFFLLRLLKYPSSNRPLERQFLLKLKELCLEKEYDLIVSVINPPESASALLKYKRKNPNQNVAIYEIDPPSNRYKKAQNTLEKFLKKRAINWSIKIYQSFDHIIHMKTHASFFSEKRFLPYSKKSIYLDIPSLVFSDFYGFHPTSDRIKLLYAGAFYKRLRDPAPIIQVLENVSKIVKIDVSFYIDKNTMLFLRSGKQFSDLHLFDYVEEKRLDLLIREVSCLISVGNKESSFLPSKIFKYIGSGRPIIHFYYDEEDTSLPYLSKCKNVLCVNVTNMEPDIKKIAFFLRNCSSFLPEPKEKIESIFDENSPRFTAERIIDLF